MQNSKCQSPSEEGVRLYQEQQKLKSNHNFPTESGFKKSQLQSPQQPPLIRATQWRGWMNKEMNSREAISFPKRVHREKKNDPRHTKTTDKIAPGINKYKKT